MSRRGPAIGTLASGMSRLAIGLVALAIFACAATVAHADEKLPPPPAALAQQVALVPFVDGLEAPVQLTWAPGDAKKRLFIVEKAGRVRTVSSTGKLDPRPILDVHERVSKWTEQGLLGLAFHPGFAQNGRCFVYYTDLRGNIRLVEWKLEGDHAVAGSEREWLTIAHARHLNHDGGGLVFGPDGKLYLGPGDGGAGYDPDGNGQNRAALLAKILRIDVDGPIATTRPEVVLIGMRNPWRFAFDRKTRDLYIADVGQDRWEEVDVVPWEDVKAARGNYGWSIMEGSHCTRGSTCAREGLALPVVEYSHKTGCSITGGFVYRGHDLPALDGMYFYSDYCTAIVRSFRMKGARAEEQYEWRPALDPDSKLAQVSSFGEDEAGELYVLSLEGKVYKLVPRSASKP